MLQLLRAIIKKINASDTPGDALEFLAKKIKAAFEIDRCIIFLKEDLHDQEQLVIGAVNSKDKNLPDNLTIPLYKGITSNIVKTKEPLNIYDVTLDNRFNKQIDTYQRNYKSFLGIPIQYRNQFLGILVLQNENPRSYDEAEEAFLITLAFHIGKFILQLQEKNLEKNQRQLNHFIRVQGVAAVSGVAIGDAVVVYLSTDLNSIPDKKITDIEGEIEKFKAALVSVRKETKIFAKRLKSKLPKEELELFDAHLKIIDSSGLAETIITQIKGGNWAQAAVRYTINNYIANFAQMENEYFRERAADIKDIGRRIIAYLQSSEKEQKKWPQKTILIGEEISTANLAEVPEGKLCGVISIKGSTNSHAVILARALGIPTLLNINNLSFTDLENKKIIIDGYYGQAFISPHARLLQAFQRLAQEETDLDISLEPLRDLKAETKDNHRIQMYVNTGLMADIGRSLIVGADGVGLYRTEIPFISSERFPSSEEQRIIYKQLLSAFMPRPVTMRVLDIGGDKSLPYFSLKEDNPFLGYRGIRFLLDNNEIFITQLRAMLRANIDLNNLQIMLPMITDISEVQASINLIKKAFFELQTEGYNITMPKIGVMIEVPSAVYQTYAIAKIVDFISVGSNDLTQYFLAVDRNNQQVSFLYDSLHPSILRALKYIVKSAHKANKPVGICGELAGDPIATALLIALGFDYLSMNAAIFLRVKWVIRSITLAHAKQLLIKAFKIQSADEIRAMLEKELMLLGLGGLIRVGKK